MANDLPSTKNSPNSGEIFQTFATFTLLLFSSPRRSSVISQTFAQLKLSFTPIFVGVDFVDVYVVHPISMPLVVEEILVSPSTNVDVSSSPQQDNVDMSSSPHKNRADLSSSPQIDRADVSSSQPFDENENRDLNQSPLVEEQSPLVEEQAPAPRVEEHFDSNSLYDIDENINDLSIDAGFEDIYKEKRGRFEGNLGGDNPYFDSSDPGSDISEDEGDPVENDEVVDPAPRKESTKIYFDPTAKKKNVAAGTSAATSNVAAGTSVASPSAGPNASLISATRPTNASLSGVKPATALASGGRPTIVTSSDVRQLSTQQSTSSAGGQKRKTSTALRGGATLAYKKPRPKKAKTTGYGLLFGSGGSVTARSGNTDRVLHSATLSSTTPTNIDLGYKPNGLRWKGRAAITQRQLREESYRSTQGTH
ncbi:hypothetical protein KY285_015475 [Solanum tuberosum]|nr:hypothetical protein KY285_015475 [Solanum tuberosum]